MMWTELSDDERRKWCDWVVSTCLLHGTTLYTAFSVAALFGDGLDRETSPAEGDDE